MPRIEDSSYRQNQIMDHINSLEKMRTKFINECNRSILEKSIKNIYAKCKTPGKGEQVDISV